ncbi:MAG: hypothetical protein ACRCTQ_02100 [Brevinemataceae bacterium]
MKFFSLLFLIAMNTIIYSQTFENIQTNTILLKNYYQQYIQGIDRLPTQDLQLLEQKIISHSFIKNSYTFPTKHELLLPKIELPIYTNLDKHAKLTLAENDLIKINTFLETAPLYKQLYSSKNISQQSFKEFFKGSEQYLLSLAEKAYVSDQTKAEILSRQYGLFILQLSGIPLPLEYSFYRRRRLFSIETPEAAQEEIQRLRTSLEHLN